MTALSGWEDFYVIVGSSAGALIGLQFVVITLIAEMPLRQGTEQAGRTFSTPTVVHFGAVLLLAAIVTAPWHGVSPAEMLIGAVGIAGVIYSALVTRDMRRQTAYKPELEDWMFHSVLPLMAYATLAAAAFVIRSDVYRGMFAVGAAALLLLFIGIHNAWDAVTYHVFVRRRKEGEGPEPS